ncbi:MAG: TatD family hydrolase [Planctomycetota bacterium]|jgi:TatD DNase family protein|nr:TatD family hydrolase [Planctomycetota bacterium]
MNLVDTHCHLTADRFDTDRDDMIARIGAAGIVRAITIGTGIADARACATVVAQHPNLLRMAAGLDPFSAYHAGEAFDAELAELDVLLPATGCVALGEVGLDYHYDYLPAAAVQQAQLHAQLAMAQRHGLPVVIHARECHADMQRVLAEHPGVGGVIHSFTGGPADAEAYLALGWYLAFNGIVTYKNAADVQEAAKVVPNDRLLLETDSPYLAPTPKRGKRCEPALMTHTCAFVADLRGEAPEHVAAWTTRNANSLFSLGL